jgi:hypothetical protein
MGALFSSLGRGDRYYASFDKALLKLKEDIEQLKASVWPPSERTLNRICFL